MVPYNEEQEIFGTEIAHKLSKNLGVPLQTKVKKSRLQLRCSSAPLIMWLKDWLVI